MRAGTKQAHFNEEQMQHLATQQECSALIFPTCQFGSCQVIKQEQGFVRSLA